MQKKENNYPFIDSQNLNLGVQELGWKLDFRKFRIYLQEKYSITVAYLFIGYVFKNQKMYSSLQKAGYVLIYKPTIPDNNGNIKGNIDANLVLQAMVDYNKFSKAVIVTSDGDFYCLVEYLNEKNKLEKVLSPHIKTRSSLLQQSAKEKIVFIDNLRQKLEYTKKSTA